jgi:hypothetical protein
MKKYICVLLYAITVHTADASEQKDGAMQAMWNTALNGASIGAIGSLAYVVYAVRNSKLPWDQKLKIVATTNALGIILGGGFSLLMPVFFQADIRSTLDYETWEIPSEIVGGALWAGSAVFFGNGFLGNPLHLHYD